MSKPQPPSKVAKLIAAALKQLRMPIVEGITAENLRLAQDPLIREIKAKGLLLDYYFSESSIAVDAYLNHLITECGQDAQLSPLRDIVDSIRNLNSFTRLTREAAPTTQMLSLGSFQKLCTQIAEMFKWATDTELDITKKRGFYDPLVGRNVPVEDVTLNLDGTVTMFTRIVSSVLRTGATAFGERLELDHRSIEPLSDEALERIVLYHGILSRIREVVMMWKWSSCGIEVNVAEKSLKVVARENPHSIAHWICDQRVDDTSASVMQELNLMNALTTDKMSEEMFSRLFGGDEILNLSIAGLTLKKWIRGYQCLNELKTSDERTISEYDLLELLRAQGLDEIQAFRFLDKACFSTKSEDLFDAPLVRLRDGTYILATATGMLNPFRCLLSVLRGQSEWDAKGKYFETAFREELSHLGLLSHSFKHSVKSLTIECDAAFVFDEELWLCECKNRIFMNVPYYTNAFEAVLNEATNQLTILAREVTSNPNILPEPVRSGWKRVNTLVVNSFPWSSPPRDGCYISDLRALVRFFSERHLSTLQFARTSMSTHQIIDLWGVEKPTSEALKAYLQDPPTHRLYKKFLFQRYHQFEFDDLRLEIAGYEWRELSVQNMLAKLLSDR